MLKPLPILPHMPRFVKERIVSHIDVFSRESLMQCSHEFYDLVKKLEIYEKVILTVTEIGVAMKFSDMEGNKRIIEYYKYNDGCLRKRGDSTKIIEDKTPYNLLVRDLWKLTGNPKHTVKELLLTYEDDFPRFLSINPLKEETASLLNEIQRVFVETDTMLNAKGVYFDMDQDMIYRRPEAVELDQDAMMKLISICKPGFLRRFFFTSMRHGRDISKLIASEQWKRAENVVIDGGNVPAHSVTHFKYAAVWHCSLSQEEFEGVIQSAIRQGKNLVQFKFSQLSYDHQAALHYLSTYPGMELVGPEEYQLRLPNSEYNMYFTANNDFLWMVPDVFDE